MGLTGSTLLIYLTRLVWGHSLLKMNSPFWVQHNVYLVKRVPEYCSQGGTLWILIDISHHLIERCEFAWRRDVLRGVIKYLKVCYSRRWDLNQLLLGWLLAKPPKNFIVKEHPLGGGGFTFAAGI